jgi:drug/metabolite transporter (DMT)-like permease
MSSASPTRSWLALGGAITCWTLSPLLIFKSSGLAPSPIVALFAVAIGATFGVVFLAQSPNLSVRVLIKANYQQHTIGRAMVIGAGTFLVYPLLYFSALQSAHSLALVNLVNYLWPVIGVALVAAIRHDELTLETILAISFGFAGAAIAISTAHTLVAHGTQDITPFVLAGLGAIVYGGVSAFMRLHPDESGAHNKQMLVLALLVAGLAAYITLGVLFLVHRSWVVPHITSQRLTALGIYSVFLPIAHLSWLTAVQDERVSAFPAAFVIPVTGTGVLALVVSGQASPAVLSALVLVLCGIAFSTMTKQIVPLRFAVTLGFLASIQVSLALVGRVHDSVNTETAFLAQVLVALLAIFAGFVLTNAIQRYNTLQRCCAAFYGKVARTSHDTLPQSEMLAALDQLDKLVLVTGENPGSTVPAEPKTQASLPAVDSSRSESPGLEVARMRFPEEWARVGIALLNKVSPYEWLVLFLGSSGLILASQFYAVNSRSAAMIVIRALTVAFIAGVVFAIRDYDKHRPAQIMGTLDKLRHSLNLKTTPGSPLAKARASGATRGPGSWEVMGLTVLVLAALVAIALNLGSLGNPAPSTAHHRARGSSSSHQRTRRPLGS